MIPVKVLLLDLTKVAKLPEWADKVGTRVMPITIGKYEKDFDLLDGMLSQGDRDAIMDYAREFNRRHRPSHGLAINLEIPPGMNIATIPDGAIIRVGYWLKGEGELVGVSRQRA